RNIESNDRRHVARFKDANQRRRQRLSAFEDEAGVAFAQLIAAIIADAPSIELNRLLYLRLKSRRELIVSAGHLPGQPARLLANEGPTLRESHLLVRLGGLNHRAGEMRKSSQTSGDDE